MSVKPWQKATLSVMAGSLVYAGFLNLVTTQVQQNNQEVYKKKQAMVTSQRSLDTKFEEKKAELLSLEKKLQDEEKNTATVVAEIAAVNREIAQISTGHIPGSSVSVSSVSVQTPSTPSVQLPNVQPPPVQSVTKAS